MNSYERIMKAMRHEEPDRVPIVEFVIDKNVYRALMPEARFQSDFEAKYEFDAVTCKNEYAIMAEQHDTFIDEWGVQYKKNSEQVMLPLEGPIHSSRDLKTLILPDPDRPERFGRLPELVRRFKGEKAIIFHQRECFLWSTYLMGMENLLVAFIEEPEFAHELLDRVLDVNIRLARNAIRAGADIITISDDYAYNEDLLFSPWIFEEFIRPGLKKMVDAIHEEGALVIKHSDGNLTRILDRIVDTGIDGLNPIDPQAGMDIEDIKQRYGNRISIWGNVDCSWLLTFGSEDDVDAAVKDCIRKTATGGGFILTSSNSIHSSVKPSNYLSMIHAARKYGQYPVSV